jgi:hypothetical protein
MVCDNNESRGNGSNNDLRCSNPLTTGYCLRQLLLVSSVTAADLPTSERAGVLPTRSTEVSSVGCCINTKRSETGGPIFASNEHKESVEKILQAAIDLVNDDDMSDEWEEDKLGSSQ